MSADKYKGWANRETWCANLWLANDEGLYHQVREMAQDAISEVDPEDLGYFDDVVSAASYEMASALKDFYEDLVDCAFSRGQWDGCKPSDELVTMIEDIGSAWRVEWSEIADSWVADEIVEASA